MANIVVTDAHVLADPDGDELVLTYRLPGALDENRPGYGGHEHHVPIRAVHVRMLAYGIDKTEALEECVLERLEPGLLTAWPANANVRAQGRARHNLAAVRRFADLIPNPTGEETDMLRGMLVARGVLHEPAAPDAPGSGSDQAGRRP